MVSLKEKLLKEYQKNPSFEAWNKYKNCPDNAVEDEKPKMVAPEKAENSSVEEHSKHKHMRKD